MFADRPRAQQKCVATSPSKQEPHQSSARTAIETASCAHSRSPAQSGWSRACPTNGSKAGTCSGYQQMPERPPSTGRRTRDESKCWKDHWPRARREHAALKLTLHDFVAIGVRLVTVVHPFARPGAKQRAGAKANACKEDALGTLGKCPATVIHPGGDLPACGLFAVGGDA